MKRLAVSGSLLVLACSACNEAPSGPADGGLQLRFAGLGTCSDSGNKDGQFPSNADRVVVELSGGALAQPHRAQASASTATAEGEIIFPEVPVGDGYTLRVAACSGTTTRWAGRTTGIDIAEFQKSFPPVFLTPVDILTCTGTATTPSAARQLSEPRAFAALAASGDGAYVLGGGKKFTIVPPNLIVEGTQSVDRYDLATGSFAAAGSLSSVRVGAVARPQADGTVRVIGGAAKLRIAAPGKPGVWADPVDTPSSATEIYDPGTGSSTVEVATPLAALPSIGVTSAGAVVAIGGTIATGSGYSDELVIMKGKVSTRGAAVGGGRFGATVVPLGGDLVLVWGGNVDGAVANAAVVVDTGKAADVAGTLIGVSGLDAVPYAASGALLGESNGIYQVLIVGGGKILAGGNFGATTIGAARLQIVTVDPSGKTATVDDVDFADVGAGPLTRAFGSLAELPDGDFLYFGGYTAFTSDPLCSTPSDCLQNSVVRFAITDPGGAATAEGLEPTVALNGGPLGAGAVALADGTWLLTNGIDSITGSTLSKDTGIVRYADPNSDLCTIVPPEAAAP